MVADTILRLTPSRRAASRSHGGAAPAARSDEWGALMAAAQAGHGGAYQRLLTEISDWLVQYFRRRLPAGEVDDAVQETLLAIHRRRHTYDPRLPLAPWLAGIARRKWIDQLRSMGRRPSGELPADLAVADHEAAVTSASVLASLLDGLRPAQAQVITPGQAAGIQRGGRIARNRAVPLCRQDEHPSRARPPDRHSRENR